MIKPMFFWEKFCQVVKFNKATLHGFVKMDGS